MAVTTAKSVIDRLTRGIIHKEYTDLPNNLMYLFRHTVSQIVAVLGSFLDAFATYNEMHNVQSSILSIIIDKQISEANMNTAGRELYIGRII